MPNCGSPDSQACRTPNCISMVSCVLTPLIALRTVCDPDKVPTAATTVLSQGPLISMGASGWPGKAPLTASCQAVISCSSYTRPTIESELIGIFRSVPPESSRAILTHFETVRPVCAAIISPLSSSDKTQQEGNCSGCAEHNLPP